uniref:Lactoylglutathione lyase n=2 Tax=Quercus lobata TaxID=97700 RepID=A0A7N2R2E9_QUELO
MEEMEQKLKDLNIKYKKRTVEDVENWTKIDKLCFNDPSGFMIEICNCENLKLVPAGSLGKIKLPDDRHNPPVELENSDDTK